ncbi:MAG: malonate transporter [Hyphomicrobiales bacterium]|nr:MAG: malonate transporter [Hyphomicrobiales bacterium]
MSDIIALSLPFFGLIFLGFVAGKIVRLPEDGLAWLNIFVVYIALPALFFQIIAQTPLEELASPTFILVTTFSTLAVFVLAFGTGMLATRGNVSESTIQALGGSYSNIGYMGPGLTLAALGDSATVPTALIFCFDSILLFTLIPSCMSFGRGQHGGFLETLWSVFKKIILHPFILATIAGVIAAAVSFSAPQWVDQILNYLRNAAAPCALFAMGVSIALRAVKRFAPELPVLLLIKLVIHPALVFSLLSFVGGIQPAWMYTAALMAALPPAANVFVVARQYDTYVERASSIVMIGTIVSIVTVTGLLYLIASERLLPGMPWS